MSDSLDSIVNNLKKKDLYTNDAEEAVKRILDDEEQQHDIMTWGKYKGKKIADIVQLDRKYAKYLLRQKYSSKELLQEILKNLI